MEPLNQPFFSLNFIKLLKWQSCIRNIIAKFGNTKKK